jgi:phospholipid transport system substrate-binding protein
MIAPGEARAGAPTDALRDFFAAVNVALSDPTTEDEPVVRLRAIRRYVDEVFDFREAAMLALGREWGARTPVEQNEFVALFADLLERSFVWRVAGKATTAGGLKVDYLSETAADDSATVETALAARDGNPLRLGFQMVRRSERWVVRDIVMDGVSTMENYHAQFQRLVRDGSWPELVAQLRAKVGVPEGPVRVASATPAALEPTEPAGAGQIREPVMAPTPEPERPREAPVPASIPEIGVIKPAPPPQVVARPEPARVQPRIQPPRPVARAAVRRPATPTWWVQVGAYRSAATAGRVAARVRGEILVVATSADGRAPLLRVRVGPFTDRARALARLHELQGKGWRGLIARRQD